MNSLSFTNRPRTLTRADAYYFLTILHLLYVLYFPGFICISSSRMPCQATLALEDSTVTHSICLLRYFKMDIGMTFVVGPGFRYLIPRDCSSIVMCHIGNGNVTTREVSIFIMHHAIQNILTLMSVRLWNFKDGGSYNARFFPCLLKGNFFKKILQ